MKFIVSSSALLNHLVAMSRVISSKNSLPILDCFLLDVKENVLSITAADNETTMDTSLEILECDGSCRFAISSKTLLEAIKEIPEQPITVEVNPDSLEIIVNYMNGKFNLIGQNANEYPIPATLNEDAARVNVPADVLLDGLSTTLFAAADDELRPTMNGIYFDMNPEDLTFVASDGHKLVRNRNYSIKSGEKAAFILPKKPASLLKNLLAKEQEEVTVEFDDRNAIFTMVNYQMVCRLIEGRYPNYNSVIPQNNPNRATVDRMSFLSAARRVSVCSSQGSSLLKLRLQDNNMVVSAQDIDFSTSAEESLTCQYDGTPISIGFKGSFLIDILNNISGQDIVIELADSSRAGVIVPAEKDEARDILMLLMPMMLND